MEKIRSKARPSSQPANQRRSRPAFLRAVGDVNRRAHEKVNQRSGKRGGKSIRAAISASAPLLEEDGAGLGRSLLRAALALALLPLCWVTAWTFLSRFSMMTLSQGFWQSAEFWYFTVGVIVMAGWFFSGLLRQMFLYLYVLGHEMTHAVFVVLCRGRVTDFSVSTEGGYITTNKTNFVIALSPYFFPWWSVLAVCLFVLARLFCQLPGIWDLVMYGVMGFTWTFHVLWTLWMLPRDQPDLQENGTFLSLVIILFGNLLVLVALLCLASRSPLDSFQDFGREWLRHAATWGDAGLRWLHRLYVELRVFGKV